MTAWHPLLVSDRARMQETSGVSSLSFRQVSLSGAPGTGDSLVRDVFMIFFVNDSKQNIDFLTIKRPRILFQLEMRFSK